MAHAWRGMCDAAAHVTHIASGPSIPFERSSESGRRDLRVAGRHCGVLPDALVQTAGNGRLLSDAPQRPIAT